MDVYTATEMAYKNGYEQGLKDSVKHGEWKVTDTLLGKCCVCSVCGSCPTMSYRYCPYCGAKMKE